jgi:plasmid maintenance system antidote protein VapI
VLKLAREGSEFRSTLREEDKAELVRMKSEVIKSLIAGDSTGTLQYAVALDGLFGDEPDFQG